MPLEALGLEYVTGRLGADARPAAHHQRVLGARLVKAIPRLERLTVHPTGVLDLCH